MRDDENHPDDDPPDDDPLDDDPLDVFLDEADPDEHDDWTEWGSGYYAGVSVTIGAIGDRSFLIWNAFEGTDHGWEDWDGERCDADAAAETFAADMAGIDGDQPDPTATFGLQNLEPPEPLPTGIDRLGTLTTHHTADGDDSYPAFAVYRADHGEILVTRRHHTDVIGRFDTLDAARAAFDPPGYLGAVLHPTREHADQLPTHDDWSNR
ncbi:MAG: hypothetical protein ACO3WU_13625 [Ilumatobacteraceae bacterium]